MKKVFLILALVFTLSSNACIGSLQFDDFYAEGNFNNGYEWRIAMTGDGRIHHTVYYGGGIFTDTVITWSEAVRMTNSYHAQGFGGDGC